MRRRLTEKKGPCWDGYERVPGTKAYEKGSCRKKGSKSETDEVEEMEELQELRRSLRRAILAEKKRGLWDNIHAKRDRGEPPAQPGDDDYPATLDVNEYDELMEVDEHDEGNAFSGARQDAIDAGEDEFEVGGEKFKVTGKKEKMDEATLRRMIRSILIEACYDNRKVTLNKPSSNRENPKKKSKVYVSSGNKYKSGPCKGQVKAKKVQFGDPNMKIRKSNPKARKSFRARHNCANPGPKDKARYWSCKAW